MEILYGSSRAKKQIGDVNSKVKIINTGAPQGCVISPLLFSFYTSDCLCSSPNCSLIKYADDTVITGYLKDDPLCYISEIEKFVDWCDVIF